MVTFRGRAHGGGDGRGDVAGCRARGAASVEDVDGSTVVDGFAARVGRAADGIIGDAVVFGVIVAGGEGEGVRGRRWGCPGGGGSGPERDAVAVPGLSAGEFAGRRGFGGCNGVHR